MRSSTVFVFGTILSLTAEGTGVEGPAGASPDRRGQASGRDSELRAQRPVGWPARERSGDAG